MSEMNSRCVRALDELGPVDLANYAHRERIVRAILDQLREPTDEMLAAGEDAMATARPMPWDYVEDIWAPMIDAVLGVSDEQPSAEARSGLSPSGCRRDREAGTPKPAPATEGRRER